MHLFDTTDPGPVTAQKKFYITIVVLSVGTYVAAFLAYWLVRNRKGYTIGKGLPEDIRASRAEGRKGMLAGEKESLEANETPKWLNKNLASTLFKRKRNKQGKQEESNEAVV